MENGVIETSGDRITFTKRLIRNGISILSALTLSLLFSLALIRFAPPLRETLLLLVPESRGISFTVPVRPDQFSPRRSFLQKRVSAAERELDNYIPRQPYLIVNTTHNTFRLMKYTGLIREGMCSTGSYTILTSGPNQKWVFETPRGMLKVRSKQMSPVWVKPDWAFIEEGLPVPSPRHASRYDYGTLGDYKLELGNGYLIHGTLYKRFLGMAVTHGCIRLGDEDLELVYSNLKKGSKVYIY